MSTEPWENEFIFDGKRYNVEKSSLIAKTFTERQSLYKTQRGNYFLIRNWRGFMVEFLTPTIAKGEENRALTVDEAKKWLMDNNLLEAYQMEFGELEEA